MLLFFILGAFIGSFLGVLVDRIPRDETIIKGHSHCEFCKKELKWIDLIPIFSFLLLKGKCRYCKAELSLYYPIIELTTGLMFALIYAFLIFNSQFSIINFLYYLFIISSLIVIFFTDLKYGIIPDKILLSAAIINLVYLFLANSSLLTFHLISAIGALIFFITLFLITKGKGMGIGDVKLAFLMGLFLGFPQVIVGLYVAFLTGALVSIILVLWGKKNFFKGTIPFGPFLVLGTLISIFLGNILLQKSLLFLGL